MGVFTGQRCISLNLFDSTKLVFVPPQLDALIKLLLDTAVDARLCKLLNT